MPCRIVFAKPEDVERWPNHLSFHFLTRVRSSAYSPMSAWIILRTSSLVTWSLCEMFNSLQQHLISKAYVIFSESAVSVHDSQVYRNMEMTREPISFTFDPTDMLLSLQMGFSFARAAVACAVREIISNFEAIIWNNYSKVLEACYSTQLLPFCIYLSLDAIGAVCHQLGLLGTNIHLIYTLCRFSRDFLLGLLALALPKLEHLCHRHTADW